MPSQSLQSERVHADPFIFDRPVLALSCFAIPISIAIFVLSLLDFGIPFVYINPFISASSIMFLTISLWLRCLNKRHMPVQNDLRRLQLPKHAILIEILAYFFAVAWLAPLSISIVASIPNGPLSALLRNGAGGMRMTLIIAQGILAVTNFTFMGLMAILLSVERRRYDRLRDTALFKNFTIEWIWWFRFFCLWAQDHKRMLLYQFVVIS